MVIFDSRGYSGPMAVMLQSHNIVYDHKVTLNRKLVSLIYPIYGTGSYLKHMVLLQKGMHKLLGMLIPTKLTPTHLDQTNIPIHLDQPISPIQFLQVLSMFTEPLRTHIYKAQHLSFSLRADEVQLWLDGSLSSTTNVLFQRTYQLLNDTTE